MKRFIIISVACILAAFVAVASVVVVPYLMLPASPWNIKRGMALDDVERCVGRPADFKETSATYRNMTFARWNKEQLEVLFDGGRVEAVITSDYYAVPSPTFQIYIGERFGRDGRKPVRSP